MPLRKPQVTVIASLAALGLLGLSGGAGLIFFLLYKSRTSEKLTALHFDLSNRIQIRNDPQLQFGTGPFTISFWFRTSSAQRYLTMISKRDNSLSDGWVVHGQQNNTFLFYTAGCSSPTSTPQQFRDGQWHHLALARTGTVMNIFYDSRLVGTGPDPCNHNDKHAIRIGMDGDKGWHFDGELAEVHFYNRGLSTAEVAEEWNNGKGLKKAVAAGGLVAGYHFGEQNGTAATDFSGNGHEATLIRSPKPVGERN